MARMSYSLDGLHLTKQFEGCRLVAYQDVNGIYTVGYGHTGPLVVKGLVITQAQADVFLQMDIQWASNVVNALVTASLTQPEFDALVDFVFNAGSGNFAKSTLHVLLNKGEMHLAALEFDKWSYAGGRQVAGLLRRRQAETALFESGYTNDTTSPS